MLLNFVCSGKDFQYLSKENITKYIADDDILCDKKYELSIEKEIDMNDLEKFYVHIYVSTNEYDVHWRPDKRITMSNARVLILKKQ